MRLLKRRVVGTDDHRSGWPRVMTELAKYADGKGILLDDFADASFSYLSISSPHDEPWIGLFHNPVIVDSPLPADENCQLRQIVKHRRWRRSQRALRGTIALCNDVAVDLQAWLKVPTLALMHPTERDVPRWDAEASIKNRRLVQVGFFLRNTQLIFQIAVPGWHRVRLLGDREWHRSRDEALQSLGIRPDCGRNQVELLQRIENTAYDKLLAESVVVTELYGAAANNLVVECMVRGTPILINRLPAVEEYLGRDYPLFYDRVTEIPSLLEPALLLDASHHLVERSALLPSFEQFAQRILEFANAVGRSRCS